MRPSKDEYLMGLALAVSARADCKGRQVGALLARDGLVLTTGYNGTPAGMPNCSSGGCVRCADPETYPKGTAYDLCICVHAEQNCLLSAARHGVSVAESLCYTTMRPCYGCLKEMIQADVRGVRYLTEWHDPPTPELAVQLARLEGRFPRGIAQVEPRER